MTPESPDEIRCRSDPQIPADETVMSSPSPEGSSWSVTKTKPDEDITARIGKLYYSVINRWLLLNLLKKLWLSLVRLLKLR